MGEKHHAPRAGDTDTGQVHDDFECVLGQEGAEGHANKTQRRRNDDPASRNLMSVEFRGDLRSLTSHCEGPQRASGGVEASVERTQGRGEHDDLNDVAGVGNTDPGEERHER